MKKEQCSSFSGNHSIQYPSQPTSVAEVPNSPTTNTFGVTSQPLSNAEAENSETIVQEVSSFEVVRRKPTISARAHDQVISVASSGYSTLHRDAHLSFLASYESQGFDETELESAPRRRSSSLPNNADEIRAQIQAPNNKETNRNSSSSSGSGKSSLCP